MDANGLWLPTLGFSTLSEMNLRRGRVLLEIGEAMRLLCCLLLICSVLLNGCGGSEEAAAVAAIENMGGKVGFEEKILGKLVSVHLAGRRVTDAGLVHLKGLTSLKKLDLKKTSVTSAGVKDLQSALPNCKISK